MQSVDSGTTQSRNDGVFKNIPICISKCKIEIQFHALGVKSELFIEQPITILYAK